MKQPIPIIWFPFRKGCLIAPLLFVFIISEFPFSLKVGEEHGGLTPDARASLSQPTWVIDPTNPGEDAPPAGRSLFDHLVIRQKGESNIYNIPYPFSALLRNIEKTAESLNSSSRFKVVVIPYGRSLHRYAAQSNFFRFPRILATIDADDAEDLKTRQGTRHPPLYLKDRLFLAYQEKAAIIEVISYNEAAGRFEFQIVRNYQPETSPQVVYANRKVCTACHQNQAPIFPEPLWHETNAHPLIHKLLQPAQIEFSSIDHGVDIAAAFDAATDRANEILVSQKLWQEGCETPAFPQQSVECRASLLTAALQQRLSGSSPFLGTSSPHEYLLSSLLQTWKSQWPHGLWLPNPNIPNRPIADVLAFIAPEVSDHYFSPTRDGPQHMHPLMDPLTPRPPLATWTFAPPDRFPWIQFMTSLANLFSQADILKLNDLLIKIAGHQHLSAMQYHSHCATTIHAETEKTFELKLECNPSSTSLVAPRNSFSLNGRVMFEEGQSQRGTLHRLQIGQAEEHDSLNIREAFFQEEGAQEKLTLLMAPSASGLPVRTHEGNLMEALVLQWPLPFPSPGIFQENPVLSDATLDILPDFSLIQKAVKMMVQETSNGHTDALGHTPFRRVKLVQSLLHYLDPPARIWCCEEPLDLPPVVLDAHPSSGKIFARTNNAPAPLQLLDRYCGDCHHGDDSAPPGFLHGSISNVENNLTQCAERMYVRLGMWQVPPTERRLSPMPPPTALSRLTTMPGDWPQQEEFRLLKQYVQELIIHKGGSPPLSGNDLTLQGYAALPTCLSSSTSHTTVPPIP